MRISPLTRASTIGWGLVLALGVTACGDKAQTPLLVGQGAQLQLPAPRETLVPTVHIAPVQGWTEQDTPQAAAGMSVHAFARDLEHPRWLLVLPNGDVLVAETAAPPRAQDDDGLKARVQGWLMKRAGSAVPSPNRIRLLRDGNGDGVADQRTVFLAGLHSPFGMALVEDQLYVANTDALMRYPYLEGQLQIEAPGTRLAELPAGPRNHHWTKGLIASADGRSLFVSVGSNSNIAEHGMDQEHERAAILQIDAASGARRVYASGLRNPVGMAWQPERGALWVAVNERDELGSDLVPDYITAVREGGFYGWPYSYFGTHVDTRVDPEDPLRSASAIVPDYALGAHTASLGLAYSRAGSLPPAFTQGLFVGQHGSWNRRPRSGYKVVFVRFENGAPVGVPEDVLTGFVEEQGRARGRPVGVAMDHAGALLVADDVGNTIWRVQAAAGTPGLRAGVEDQAMPAELGCRPVAEDEEQAAGADVAQAMHAALIDEHLAFTRATPALSP